ncbi:MAG: LPS assembly lipoprotein LptE [Steroidobacteraceae bacterium]|nr:LPS assembly lipoprotein LptE [Steroidobacteraceae bacterium]
MTRAGIVLGFLVLLLAGCGFHLKGAVSLPADVKTVYVATNDELSPFAVELGRALDAAGAVRATSASVADAVIRVAQDRTGRRVLSVSARNTPQEYQVYYMLGYSIERGDQKAVEPQEIELSRSYSFSESDLLAKDREETILREGLARDLADLVVRRLASL